MCLAASRACYTCSSLPQMDCTQKGGGLHWVTVATYENLVSGAVSLYDGGPALGVSIRIEMSVCKMLRSPREFNQH